VNFSHHSLATHASQPLSSKLRITPPLIEVIHRRIPLHTLPNRVNLARRLVTQLPLPQSLRSLFNLRHARRAKDDTILGIVCKRRVERNPSVRQLRFTHALLLRNLVPLDECLAHARVVVELRVHATEGLFVEAARAGVEVRCGFGEEAACEGAVGVEFDAEFFQRWEEDGLGVARDGAVVSLVDGGEDVAVCFADVVGLLDLVGRVVAQAETAEYAFFVGGVDAREGFLEGDGGVGCVDVSVGEVRYRVGFCARGMRTGCRIA
jgi:hypothetical protein